jgi:sec-independent protein translocase protein TatA
MGTPEIMIIMFAVLLLFGGKKIPELARGLGKGIREFKDASEGVKREIHNSINNVTEGVNVDVSAKTADFSNSQTSTADVSSSEGINLDKKTSTGDVTVPEEQKQNI